MYLVADVRSDGALDLTSKFMANARLVTMIDSTAYTSSVVRNWILVVL